KAPLVEVPMENVDDDNFDVIAFASSNVTSEPFYGLSATITIYLKTEPKDTVLFSVTSTHPTEAGPDRSILSFSKDDFQVAQIVFISSFDDRYLDGKSFLMDERVVLLVLKSTLYFLVIFPGDIAYNITIATLFSDDPDYGSPDPNPEGRPG